MRKTRPYVLSLAVALAAAVATSSTVPPAAGPSASGHVDLSSGPAGVPLALMAASGGDMDRAGIQRASARTAGAAAVAGAEGAGRAVAPLGDVDADGRVDIVDLRASGSTLDVTGVSGRTGLTLWTRRFTDAPYGAAFPASLDAGGKDAYVLIQSEANGSLSWTVHALDGSSGVTLWARSGSVPSGSQPVRPPTPSVPPTLSPAPSLPPVTVPTAAPSTLPTIDPTAVPSADPTTVPSADPTVVPTVEPSAAPTVEPSALPSSLPDPFATGTPAPSPGVPSDLPTPVQTPTTEPTSVPSTSPPSLPTLPSPPPGGGAGSAGRAQSTETAVLPATIQAMAIGLAPVDVDGDERSDFPLVIYETGLGPDRIPVMAATLLVLSATDGAHAGLAAAVARGGVPYVGVASDMSSDGLPDVVTADEIVDPTAGVALTTWRGATMTGRPLWGATDSFDAGSVAVVTASADLTGDEVADMVVHRLPASGSGKDSVLSVRSGLNGTEVWKELLPEASVVTAGSRINADEAADVVVQAVVGGSSSTIPDNVTYRALSGTDKSEIYVERYAFPCAGCLGAWTATLTGDAGDLNADGSNDLTHAATAFPMASASSSTQAGVNARTGQTLWRLDCACAPSTPLQANLAAGPGQDLIEAKEVVTRTTDSVALRAASGADATTLWSTSVVLGTGNDRIRSMTLTPADLTGNGSSDVLLTVVQRSGSIMRSVVVAVRGSNGRIIWIRSK